MTTPTRSLALLADFRRSGGSQVVCISTGNRPMLTIDLHASVEYVDEHWARQHAVDIVRAVGMADAPLRVPLLVFLSEDRRYRDGKTWLADTSFWFQKDRGLYEVSRVVDQPPLVWPWERAASEDEAVAASVAYFSEHFGAAGIEWVPIVSHARLAKRGRGKHSRWYASMDARDGLRRAGFQPP